MKKYQAKISDIEAEIRDQEIIIDQIITIKMLNNLGRSFGTYLIILNESARNEEKFLARSTLFKNLADEEFRMRLDSNVTTNLASRFNHKRKSKKNKFTNEREKKEEKSRDDYVCYRCETSGHFRKQCSHKAAVCSKCKVIDHLEKMCPNEGFNERKKIDNENYRNVSLMIKIIELTDHSHTSSIISLINQFIIKKIIDFETIDHIFCNKRLFISLTTSKSYTSFEIEIDDKFFINEMRTVILHLINEMRKTFNVFLHEVLFASTLQYNLVSTIKLAKSGIEIMLRLSDRSSRLILDDEVIDLADIINNQYILRDRDITNELIKSMILSIIKSTILLAIEPSIQT